MTARPAILLALAAVFAGGCPSSAPSRFFVLTPTSEQAGEGDGPPSLGVGPITLAEYLDRPGLVRRVGENEVEPLGTARWAGSLEEVFGGALRQNLERLLDTRTKTYPWDPANPPPLAVEVKLRRFEKAAAGPARLKAEWTIAPGDGGDLLKTGEVAIAEPVKTADPSAVVAALSRAVEQLAEAIARDVRAIRAGS